MHRNRSRRRGRWRASVVAGLIIITTVASGITTAAAASVFKSSPPVPGQGVEGTIAARHAPSGRAVVKHAAVSGPATATGALSTVISEQVHGGYTAAGIGMRNLGYGTISITGVPAGAAVKSATLVWDVLADQTDPTFANGTLDGSPINGTEWASGASPCWPVGSNFSYEADVTSLVKGNGSYSLAGFATGESDGADPWNVGSTPPLLEGASLIVVYQLASMPQVSIQIAEGATETDSGNPATATLDGFTVAAPAAAKTTYIVADGQAPGNTASYNGTTLTGVGFPGGDPQAAPTYSLGNLWDTVTTDVSSLTSPGATSASLSVTGNDDCLVWVGQVLSVTNASMSSVTYNLHFKLWIPQRLVVDPANPLGSTPYPVWKGLAKTGLEPDLSHPSSAIGQFQPGSSCSDPKGILKPLKTSVKSTLGGDGYAGYDGGKSFRADATVSFTWDGSAISNLSATYRTPVSHRLITETGAVKGSCVEYHNATTSLSAAQTTPSTLSIKLSGVVGFLPDLTKFFGAYPKTSWTVNVSQDGSLGISYSASEFPTTALRVSVNGQTKATDLVNDASCYPESSLLGPLAVGKLVFLFHSTTKGSLPSISPNSPAASIDNRSPGC